MIYLHKLIPYLIYPVTIILTLLIIGIIYQKKNFIIFATVILIFTSSPPVSRLLWEFLEKDYPKKEINNVANADAIVVLSGMLTLVKTEKGFTYEWSDPDRFYGGIELIKAGKGKFLVFTDGSLPWGESFETEGIRLSKYAIQHGIDKKQIYVTHSVQNTDQEAKAVKSFLVSKNLKSIILVTSGFHMQRAKMLFENQNIIVEAFPVDSRLSVSKLTLMDLLPSAEALLSFQIGLREMVGREYYRFFY